MAPPGAAASGGMSGRQGAEPGGGGIGGDAAPMTGIVIGEVATEAPSGLVRIGRLARKLHERDAFAVGREVLPGRAKHAVLVEPILARHVERERAGERPGGVQARGCRAVGGGDLSLALLLRHEDEEVREPNQVLFPRPPRCEAQVALELARERAACLRGPVVLEVEIARSARMQVAPEPVGLDLRRFGADPATWPGSGPAGPWRRRRGRRRTR